MRKKSRSVLGSGWKSERRAIVGRLWLVAFLVNAFAVLNVAIVRAMKSDCEEKILKLEAELKEFKQSTAVKLDISKAVDDALIRLERITQLYSLGDIEQKQYIIGSIFTEKWQILDSEGRTRITNPAARLINLSDKQRFRA